MSLFIQFGALGIQNVHQIDAKWFLYVVDFQIKFFPCGVLSILHIYTYMYVVCERIGNTLPNVQSANYIYLWERSLDKMACCGYYWTLNAVYGIFLMSRRRLLPFPFANCWELIRIRIQKLDKILLSFVYKVFIAIH